MEKKLSDYLHLYLGCECVWGKNQYVPEVGSYNSEDKVTLAPSTLLNFLTVKNGICSDIKPILRLLSDMGTPELLEIMNICYEYVYDHKPSFESVEFVPARDGGGLKTSEENGKWNYGLTVNEINGALFSANGSYLQTPVFDIAKYLLSKHFDLFGLIEAGLAIEKTKTK